MKIEVEIKKKYFVAIMATLLVIAGTFFVVSYVGPNGVGHSLDEINLSGVCLSNGTGCSSTCVLYENVHAKTCPPGKHIVEYSLDSSDGCLGIKNSGCSISGGSCPSGILTYVVFGRRVTQSTGFSTSVSCNLHTSSDLRYGDILCC